MSEHLLEIFAVECLRHSPAALALWHDEHNSQGHGGEVLDHDPLTAFLSLCAVRRRRVRGTATNADHQVDHDEGERPQGVGLRGWEIELRSAQNPPAEPIGEIFPKQDPDLTNECSRHRLYQSTGAVGRADNAAVMVGQGTLRDGSRQLSREWQIVVCIWKRRTWSILGPTTHGYTKEKKKT
jgi:hypothetical protein